MLAVCSAELVKLLEVPEIFILRIAFSLAAYNCFSV